MNIPIKEIVWRQFGASIDMLENAIIMCPENVWDNGKKFWYIAYHCLFFLDYYLTLHPENFSPPKPFSLSEFDPNDAMPERTYTKDELLSYLGACREKCNRLISGMTEEVANQRWINERRNYPVLEILLYNMRHVQHHTAQLNMLLRQEINNAPKWVPETKHELLE